MKSNTPISASVEAAVTAPTSKSEHSAMKCVWIRPLVLRPQMKKVAARIQKAPEPTISPSVRARRRGAARSRGGAAALSP